MTPARRLIVVAGFLGSGKTSLILGLGRLLVQERGCSVAIIENEINAGGVDGQVLTRSGLTVRELSAGCVCCTLRTDLAATLQALEDDLHPEVVIVEPSGVAGPALVVEALRQSAPHRQPQVVGLIDATRLGLLLEINPFLVEGLMAVAAVVVLNKCDAVDDATVQRHRATLADIEAHPTVLSLSCRQEAHVRPVLDALDQADLIPASPVPGHHPALAAAAVARQWTWTLPAAGDAVDWRRRLEGLLTSLAAVVPVPRDLLGHLKLFAEAGDAGWLAGSLTTLAGGVAWQGALPAPVTTLRVTLHAIVTGMSRGDLAALVDGRIAQAS